MYASEQTLPHIYVGYCAAFGEINDEDNDDDDDDDDDDDRLSQLCAAWTVGLTLYCMSTASLNLQVAEIASLYTLSLPPPRR